MEKKIPILVAWNAPFDKGFFERSYFKMIGPLKTDIILYDAMNLYKEEKNQKLSDLVSKFLNYPENTAGCHEAEQDVLNLKELIERLMTLDELKIKILKEEAAKTMLKCKNCKSGCGPRCPCFKDGRGCTFACSCINCTNVIKISQPQEISSPISLLPTSTQIQTLKTSFYHKFQLQKLSHLVY